MTHVASFGKFCLVFTGYLGVGRYKIQFTMFVIKNTQSFQCMFLEV